MRVGVAGARFGLVVVAVLAGALAQGAAGQVTVIHGTPPGPSAAQVLDDTVGTVDMVLRAGGAGGAGVGGRKARRGGSRRRAGGLRAAPVGLVAAAPGAEVPPGRLVARRGAPLDNDQVVMLTRAGLGDAAVAALVQTSAAHYDVSTEALIGLRRAGVGSAVIAAMITEQAAADAGRVEPESADPLQPHPPGVYVLADWLDTPRMIEVHALASDRSMVGGFLGYAVAGGMFPVHYNAVVRGAHAGLMAGVRRPTFYVYAGAGVPDPAALALVRFAVRKDGRMVGIGSVSFAGAHNGVPAKQSLPFDTREVAPGVTALRPEDELDPGEYGFVQTGAGMGTGITVVATSETRVFDFAIGDAAAVAAHAGARHQRDEGFARGGVTSAEVQEVLPVAMDYLDRLVAAPPKPVLTKAQQDAAKPCHYPGGPPSFGCSAP